MGKGGWGVDAGDQLVLVMTVTGLGRKCQSSSFSVWLQSTHRPDFFVFNGGRICQLTQSQRLHLILIDFLGLGFLVKLSYSFIFIG